MTAMDFLKSTKIYSDGNEETIFSILDEFYHKKFSIAWVIDGREGGSCYGTETYPVEVEDKPTDIIDKINYKLIEHIFGKNISHQDAIEFIKEIWSEEEYDTQLEWYGNYYDYEYVTLNIKVLEQYFDKQSSKL